jgi:hypothetical protein
LKKGILGRGNPPSVRVPGVSKIVHAPYQVIEHRNLALADCVTMANGLAIQLRS